VHDTATRLPPGREVRVLTRALPAVGSVLFIRHTHLKEKTVHKVKLTIAALAVAGISAAGVGTAFAASPNSTAPAVQSAPATTTATSTTPSAAGPSDGPGGHQDPPGNVDNQSEGNN